MITDPIAPSMKIGSLVHADVFNVSSEDKDFETLQCLIFVDDFTGYKNIVHLSNGTAVEIMRGVNIVKEAYEKDGHKIEKLRTDNGGGFLAGKTKADLKTMGIEVEHCAPQSHVRVAERAIRHIKELFRSTLFDLPYLLPNELYKNLMSYIVSSTNLTINSNNDYRCPFQLMTGEAPRSHDFLRGSFGQLVTTYNQLNSNRRSDDSPRADISIIIGRDIDRKGSFYVYNIHTKSIVTRHDIAAIGWNNKLLADFHNSTNKSKAGASVRFVYADGKKREAIDLEKKRQQIENDAKLAEIDPEKDAKEVNSMRTGEAEPMAITQETERIEDEEYDEDMKRVLHCYNMTMRESSKIVGEDATEAAVLVELEALVRMEVFKFIPPGDVGRLIRLRTNIISSQMLLKQKFDSNNIFEKNKGRLVANGKKQIFDEAFCARAASPTINNSIVFAGIAIAAKKEGVDIQVIDVDNAYLNADLASPEFMYIGKEVADVLIKHHPEYAIFRLNDGRLLVELQKALYGLRTAGRDWYNLISEVLQRDGYTRCDIDKCLFIHGDGTQIFLYVDDLLVIGSPNRIESLKKTLINEFKSIKIKKGPSLSYLGMSLEKKTNGDIHVHQRGYIENLAKEYECNEVTSKYPASTNLLHREGEDPQPCSINEYLSLAMKIMFVVVRSRPDALFATTILAARCQKPTTTDYDRLLKIVQYLHSTNNQALIFKRDGKIKLRMYVDASFQTHRDTKGHSGFILFADEGSAGVLFKSKKQQCVSDSSTEAELISLHEGVKQLIWMAKVFDILGVKDQYPIDVYEDSQSAIMISSDEVVNFKGRSKFIDRKYFSVYEHVQNGKIKLLYVGTESMIADFFTKVIVGKKFESLRYSIMGGLE